MLIKITAAVTSEVEEAIAEALLVESPGGVAIEETADGILVSAFVPSERVESVRKIIEEKISELRGFGLEVGLARISLQPVDEREWATAYREHFHVEKVGRIVIQPSWEVYQPSPGEIVIKLDPGLAFGTGSHPTTRGCLLALQEYLESGWTAVDVGTGSGILAIAAAKLGAGHVFALDTDPIALEVARENASANGVADWIELIEGDITSTRGKSVDLVVANLTAPDVVAILPELADLDRLKVVVLSGILESQAQGVKEDLASDDFAVLSQLAEDGWVTVVAQH
ncbi:MAG: 50S ribosomal protein L11 methyltransferase [Actinobacteria bacterium]|nr:50S ribosomal protein L11 methyltransferase [Actinomycetota bacterium]